MVPGAGGSATGGSGSGGIPPEAVVVEGMVVGFDDARGLGEVADGSGRRWPFHCTALVDGSRTVAEGTPVTFRVVAGLAGRREATDLRR